MANYNSLIRLSEVQRRTGYSKAWIYRLISQGRFPKQWICPYISRHLLSL
ncbi:TPA: AlpA family phage regulatory protein, partial [Escherichia coli]|nr:AlpA family phage regulatory protein [Escherichia coli]